MVPNITHNVYSSQASYSTRQIVVLTAIATLALQWTLKWVWTRDWRRMGIKILRSLPPVAAKLERKRSEFIASLNQSTFRDFANPIIKLPEKGLSKEEILNRWKSVKDTSWKDAKASGAVYHDEEEIKELIVAAFALSLHANPLHSDLFPLERQMKAEIVRMCCWLYHGDENSCGSVTSGGTESLLLACLAARNRGYDLYGIKDPEIIIPTSAHAAFKKAGDYFKIKMVQAPIDSISMLVDVDAVQSLITSNTVLIVGSCPQFPHGMIDPIQQLSELVMRYKGRIGLHVDSCLGFLAPFTLRAGYFMPPFDFCLPGVTSISTDTHKYGLCPKGTSVLMFRNKQWHRYPYFIDTEWQGGIYATPTMAGSHSGALIAAAWAVMNFIGNEGYVANAKKIIQCARKLTERLRDIPQIRVLGLPILSVVAFSSDTCNIYALSDLLKLKGYHLSELQNPAALHICLTLVHANHSNFVDRFISDLQEAIHDLISHPQEKPSDTAALYGEKQKIPREFAEEMAAEYMHVIQRVKASK